MPGVIIYLSTVVLLAINAILFLIEGFEPSFVPAQRVLASMIVLFDLALVVSSVLWAIWFRRRGQRALGLLFALNLVICGAAVVVRTRGLVFRPWVFAAADLYWLNQYLITLLSQFRSLRVSSMTLKPRATERGAV